jgi:Rhodopirellula transposase DDE domain
MAASEAKAHGPSGVVLVARATGISEDTIRREIVELESGERLAPRRVRRSGSGRKPLTETDPEVVADLEALVDPVTRGHPASPSRWTSKSLTKLTGALREKGHQIAEDITGKLSRSDSTPGGLAAA